MAEFSNDLRRALELTRQISSERSASWDTDIEDLVHWQKEVFASLLTEGGATSIDAAWATLHEAEATRTQALLLHSELKAVIRFQLPLVHKGGHQISAPSSRGARRRPLKKAVGLVGIFLESLKEILGEFLGVKGRIALQLAIEATHAFA